MGIFLRGIEVAVTKRFRPRKSPALASNSPRRSFVDQFEALTPRCRSWNHLPYSLYPDLGYDGNVMYVDLAPLAECVELDIALWGMLWNWHSDCRIGLTTRGRRTLP